jgi:hypothetical protein
MTPPGDDELRRRVDLPGAFRLAAGSSAAALPLSASVTRLSGAKLACLCLTANPDSGESMKRRLTVIAASALTAAISVGISPAAHAAAKVPIRTYTERFSVDFTGFGKYAGFYSRYTGGEKVALRPHLALDTTWSNVFNLHGVHRQSGQADIGGSRLYSRNGTAKWSVTKLTAKQVSTFAYQYSPYTTQAKFDAMPGVHRITARHYQVKGTYAQVGSFLTSEFRLTAESFKGTNFKTFTIQLWLDSSARPTKITATASSSLYKFSATETFANYNTPLTIKIP